MRNDRSGAFGAGMDMVDGCLVVPVDGDADPDLLLGLMEAILAKVRKRRPKAVIINIASIRIMDTFDIQSGPGRGTVVHAIKWLTHV